MHANADQTSKFDNIYTYILLWRHNGCDGVLNHQPHDFLRNPLFRHWSKKTSKLRVTGICAGNSPVTGEFPAQIASNTENVSIWWRHRVNTGMWHLSNTTNGVCMDGGQYPIPAGTRRNNNVFTTSTRRRRRRVDAAKTLSLRHYCVMCPLGCLYSQNSL